MATRRICCPRACPETTLVINFSDRRPNLQTHGSKPDVWSPVWGVIRKLFCLTVTGCGFQGNLERNLETLGAHGGPLDALTSKIRTLYLSKYNLRLLTNAIQLLGDASWSTVAAEQGHGSSAVLHRAHRQYGPAMLSARSLVHMMRPLFSDNLEESQLSMLHARLERLDSKNPDKIHGRHMFFKSLFAASSTSSDSPMSQARKEALMVNHARLYDRLPRDAQLTYEDMALQRRHQNKRALADQRSHVLAQIEMKRQRMEEDAASKRGRLLVSNCKFNEEDLSTLASAWRNPDFSARLVEEARKIQMQAPIPIDKRCRSRVGSFWRSWFWPSKG